MRTSALLAPITLKREWRACSGGIHDLQSHAGKWDFGSGTLAEWEDGIYLFVEK